MKWTRGHQSEDIEDRRGQAPARGGGALKLGGGSAVVVVLVALVSQALGVDLSGLLGGGGGGPSQSSGPSPSDQPSQAPRPENDPDRELVEFIHFVIDDIQNAFAKQFAAEGKKYERAKLVIFTEAVDTGCGLSSSAIGPFYCPPDHRAYIDLSFYRELKSRFGAPGDFAQAYVLAHEIGHHLQNILGTDDRVRAQQRSDRRRENELSVRMELQADCYAGVWAHSTSQRAILEKGDVEEALGAAAAIGDDRLQKGAGREVNPETWTHGSSEQRVRWFKKGMESGSLAACDTFASGEL
jgi:uncharacterized protein